MNEDELVVDQEVAEARERIAAWIDKPEHQTGNEPTEDALDDPAHQEDDA